MGQFPYGYKQKQFSTSIKILTNECVLHFLEEKQKPLTNN